MNHKIEDTLRAAEGRYLTKSDQQVLREWAQALDTRLKASDEIEAKESAIVQKTLREIMSAYPDYEQRYKDPKMKGTRDLTLTLRYVVQAAVRADDRWLDDALLTWFETVLRGVGLTKDFVEDSYKTMARVISEETTPATAAVVRPYLDRVIAVLAARKAA